MTETLKYKVGDKVTVNERGFADDREYVAETANMRGVCTVVEANSDSDYGYFVRADTSGDYASYDEDMLDAVTEVYGINKETVALISKKITELAGIVGEDSKTVKLIQNYLGYLLED